MPRQRKAIPWLKVRNGVYYVYWYDEETHRTKRLSLEVPEQEAAQAQSRFAGFLAGGAEIFGPRRDARHLTVSDALDQYLREHVATKVVDRARAEGIVLLLKRWFKDTPFEEVDIPACRAYAAARADGTLVSPKRADGAGKGGGPVGESTARRELGILQAAANHAERWKRMGSTIKPPTAMPSIELPPSGEGRVVFLTKAELARAIETASGRLRDFLVVSYYTAARRRSVERLTRFQVDIKAGTINLTSPTESAIQRASKKRRPTIPIDPNIRPLMASLYMASEDANSPWLWGDKKDMYTPFNEHMTAIGLADKAFPHVLRHSRASHLLQDGVPIFHVAKLLGDTVATVERVYGHLAPADLAERLKESGT